MDLDAKLAAVGLDRQSITDARQAWLQLHECFGPRATLIDRYELEAVVRVIAPEEISESERAALAAEVFRVRDPSFRLLGERRGVDPIEVVEYDPAWPVRFEAWRERLERALGRVASRIDHVGSTAVPDLPAKPVIDVQVSVVDLSDEASFVPAIEGVGVSLRARESGHLYFRPLLPLPREVQVHVCSAGSQWERVHLLFRDFLRTSEAARQSYARIKTEMARRYPDDRVAYNEGKSELILDLIEGAERWAAETGWSVSSA